MTARLDLYPTIGTSEQASDAPAVRPSETTLSLIPEWVLPLFGIESPLAAMRPAAYNDRGYYCGTNSVVECDLAKVEVASSNLVSRS